MVGNHRVRGGFTQPRQEVVNGELLKSLRRPVARQIRMRGKVFWTWWLQALHEGLSILPISKGKVDLHSLRFCTVFFCFFFNALLHCNFYLLEYLYGVTQNAFVIRTSAFVVKLPLVFGAILSTNTYTLLIRT